MSRAACSRATTGLCDLPLRHRNLRQQEQKGRGGSGTIVEPPAVSPQQLSAHNSSAPHPCKPRTGAHTHMHARLPPSLTPPNPAHTWLTGGMLPPEAAAPPAAGCARAPAQPAAASQASPPPARALQAPTPWSSQRLILVGISCIRFQNSWQVVLTLCWLGPAAAGAGAEASAAALHCTLAAAGSLPDAGAGCVM